MASNARFAEVASLAGDPARAGMLHALMDGRALTASELARVAGITPQTASGHLARMAAAGLLQVEKAGPASLPPARFAGRRADDGKHHAGGLRLGSDAAAPATGPRDAALRAARTCYDHLAGHLGVALTDALVAGGHVELMQDAGVVTDAGIALFARIGIDVASLSAGRGKTARVLCRPAWIGANAGRTSPAPSGRPCARTASKKAGYAASKARAPSPSRPRGIESFARLSACGRDLTDGFPKAPRRSGSWAFRCCSVPGP